MNLSKRRRKLSLNNAFKQMWLDAFDEACATAKKNMELTGSRRWSDNDRDEIEFCRAKYRSFLTYHNLQDKHRSYDRYVNGMQKIM